MNRPIVLLFTAFAVTLGSCDSVEDAAPTPAASGLLATGSLPDASLGSVNEVVTLGDYTVEFLGTGGPDAEGATEFSYRVTRVGSSGPSFNYFFLENACGAAPVALSPTESVTQGTNTDSGEDIYGVQWNPSLNEGSRLYSYTFTGAQLGVVRTVIRAGDVTGVATLPGPCGGLATLSGSVFVNTDADASRSTTELGIGNVQVDVYDGDVLAASGVTSSNGGFSFTLPRSEYTGAGAYTVRVPTSGTVVFNDDLYGSYAYTGGGVPAEQSVPLNADVSGVDFGFNPDKQKIIVDLSEGGAFQTRAQDVKFWQSVIRNAARGRCVSDPYGGSDICPVEVGGYLDAIFDDASEDPFYLLSDPFVLPVGTDKFAHAADLLSRPTQTDVAKVSRNLFAMQLNLLKGWGTGSQSYDDALMSYLEEWVRLNGAGARTAGNGAGEDPALRRSPADVETAAAGGGGGGTVEEDITRAYLGGGGGGTIEG